MVNKDICNVIATGSTGNAVLLHKSILLDIGVPFIKIKPYLYDIQIVFISHFHADHLNIKTLKRLQFERPTLRITVGKHMLKSLEGLKNIDIIDINTLYDYGLFKISPVKLYHDVICFGLRVFKGDHKTFFAVDTAHLNGIEAKGYNLYLLESNYNEDTIHQQIAQKEAKGEYAYQKGAIETHLSEQQSRQFIFENKGEKYEVVRLHESKS